jgi:hypothetical protein
MDTARMATAADCLSLCCAVCLPKLMEYTAYVAVESDGLRPNRAVSVRHRLAPLPARVLTMVAASRNRVR